MGQLVQHSSAKLAQVMIGVQISPPHPIVRGHFPEDGVCQHKAWATHRKIGPGWRVRSEHPGGNRREANRLCPVLSPAGWEPPSSMSVASLAPTT